MSSRTGPEHPIGPLRRRDSLTDPYLSSIGLSPSFVAHGGTSDLRPPRPPPTKAPGAWPSTTESWATIAASASCDTFRGDQLSPDIPFRRKREVHRQRKDLKASGDFLGVQGVNPETGQLDVLTPTTGSKSTISSGASGVPASVAQESIEKYEKGKDALRRQQSLVRWRKDTVQWSSVVEPTLSPIAQSRSSTPSHPPLPPKGSQDTKDGPGHNMSAALWNSLRLSSPGWETASSSATVHSPPPVPRKRTSVSTHAIDSTVQQHILGAGQGPNSSQHVEVLDRRPDSDIGLNPGARTIQTSEDDCGMSNEDYLHLDEPVPCEPEPEPFLPLPSLDQPDPRGDMHWGLAGTRLIDEQQSESGDSLQGMMVHPRNVKGTLNLVPCRPPPLQVRGSDPMLTSGYLQPHHIKHMHRRYYQQHRLRRTRPNIGRREPSPLPHPSPGAQPSRLTRRQATINMSSIRQEERSVVETAPTPEAEAPPADATPVTESLDTTEPLTQVQAESAPTAIQGELSEPESAYIPTIIITGSATSLPLAGAGMGMGFDKAIAESPCPPSRAMRRTAPTTPRTEFRLQARSMRPSSASSRPNAKPSSSSSAGDLPRETAMNGTTSRRLAAATRMSVKKLSPSAMPQTKKAVPSAAALNYMQHHSIGNKGRQPETDFSFLQKIMPLPSTTPSPSRAKMMQQQQAIRNNTVPTQDMAQGAAYMAVARKGRLPRGGVQQGRQAGMDTVCPRQRPQQPQGKQGKQEQKGADRQPKKPAGTGGPAKAAVGRKKKQSNSRMLRDEGNVPLELVQNAGVLAFGFLLRYWTHVRPVFDRRSALRGRLRSGCLTFADAFLCVLAAGFVLTLVLVGVVVLQVLVAAGMVCQFTSRVLSFLLGM